MKRLLFIFSMVIAVSLTGCGKAYADISDDYDEIPIYSIAEIEEFELELNETNSRKEMAHQLAEAARYFGHDNDSEIVLFTQEEWSKAHEDYLKYSELIENSRWNIAMSEYPAATVIWSELKANGYSDHVAAGILGNIMTEVGGQTLNINYMSEGSGYFGMCQWNKKTYKEVVGRDLQGQINFLTKSIVSEMNSFGHCYRSYFDYESFMNLTNEQDVALAFAKCYERCGSASYDTRQKNATAAYNYFTQF